MKRILIPVTILFYFFRCEQREDPAKTNMVIKDKTTKEPIKQAESGKSDVILNYNGIVEASQAVPLVFRTRGTVKKVLIDEGDFVKKASYWLLLMKQMCQICWKSLNRDTSRRAQCIQLLKNVYDKGSLLKLSGRMETYLVQARLSLELLKNNHENHICFLQLFKPSKNLLSDYIHLLTFDYINKK